MNNKDEIEHTTSFLLTTPLREYDISNNSFISRVSYEITVTPPPNNWLLIHGTAMGAGIIAASCVYSTVKATGIVAGSTVEIGINIGGTVLSESTRLLFGDIPAAVISAATRTTATVINTGITAASSTTAVIAGALTGAAASAATLIAGITVERAHSSINTVFQYFTGSPAIQQEKQEDMSFIIYDISASNILCYETVTPKSEECNNNYGIGYSETTTMEAVQMDTKNQREEAGEGVTAAGDTKTVQTVGTGTYKQKARNRNS